MADKQQYLGEFEEIVLLAIMRLRDNAYGVTIWQTVEEVAERPTSIGAIYTTLERLEQKGFVSSWQGEPTAQRGGRAKTWWSAGCSCGRVHVEAALHPPRETPLA